MEKVNERNEKKEEFLRPRGKIAVKSSHILEKQVVTPLLHEQRPLSKGPSIY